jgi:hypothetical protein
MEFPIGPHKRRSMSGLQVAGTAGPPSGAQNARFAAPAPYMGPPGNGAGPTGSRKSTNGSRGACRKDRGGPAEQPSVFGDLIIWPPATALLRPCFGPELRRRPCFWPRFRLSMAATAKRGAAQ